MPIIGVDSETGHRLSFFYWRGRPTLYLIDERGRFVQRLDRLEVKYVGSVDYEEKKHPIYIDGAVETTITPEEVPDLTGIEEELMGAHYDILKEKFNEKIAAMTSSEGFEYSSRPEAPEYPNYRYDFIWGHSLEEYRRQKHRMEGYGHL